MHGEACMQIIYFKMFCVSVSTGTSKGDKSLIIPSDANSEGVIFQTFLGAHVSRSANSIDILYMPVCFAHCI